MSTNLIDNVSNNISLYYKGEVTINFVRNGKIFKKISKHNNGTAELFKVITNALAGNWSASTCPQYIQLFNKDTNGVYKKLLQSPQRKQSSNVKTVNTVDSKSSTLYLEFLIPRTAVSSTEVVNHVRLYSGIDDTSTFLASINLSNGSEINLADNTNANLLIKWTLTNGNAS